VPRVPPEPRSFALVILAAQRKNQVNALASAAGVSHKCLVPIAGRPLIEHVVTAIGGMPGLRLVRICVEPEAFGAVRAVLSDFNGCAIDFVSSADNLADSVHAATIGLDDTIIITTADHVLLLPPSVEAMLKILHGGADGAIAFASEKAVLAAHPDGQRRFYRFADGGYSNCNLYGLAGQRGRAGVEIFRSGGQFAKHPLRIAKLFGLFNLLLVRFSLVSLARALARVSRRIGIRIDPVVLADGTQASDVDNERTYRVVEQLLAQRQAQEAGQRRELAASPS
jgi:hypothetical protein